MTSSPALCCAALSLLFATPAFAQLALPAPSSAAVVATASAAAPAPPTPAADTSVASVADVVDDAAPGGAPPPVLGMHGQFSVGVGTHGYREVDAAVEGPIGAAGYAAIAIDSAQIGGRR